MLARHPLEPDREGSESDRLGERRTAAAGGDAAELRHREGERQRWKRTGEERPAPGRPKGRDEQEPERHRHQPRDAPDDRAEREADHEAKRALARPPEAPHPRPERGAECALIELAAHASARSRVNVVWTTWSVAKNR